MLEREAKEYDKVGKEVFDSTKIADLPTRTPRLTESSNRSNLIRKLSIHFTPIPFTDNDTATQC